MWAAHSRGGPRSGPGGGEPCDGSALCRGPAPVAMARSAALVALVALAACAAPSGPRAPDVGAPAETGAFVTLLGDDTLAVERFARTPGGMEATVALRAPRSTLTAYDLRLDADGGLVSYEAVARQPLSGEVVRRQSVRPDGDSLRVTVAEASGGGGVLSDMYTSRLSEEARAQLNARRQFYEATQKRVVDNPDEAASLIGAWIAEDHS